MKNKNYQSKIIIGFVFAFFIIMIVFSITSAEEIKTEELKKRLSKILNTDPNKLVSVIRENSDKIPSSIIERPKSEKWICHLSKSKDVTLLAICRPQKYPGLLWDPAGNPIESKSEWTSSRTFAFELAALLERPKMEGETNSRNGKYYSLYGWFGFDPNNPPAISCVCGIGEWEDIGEVKENGIVGGYKVSDVKDVSPNEKQIDVSVSGNFISDYLFRLIAVDKNGKKFPMNSSSSSRANQFSIIPQSAFGISKDELSHFILQKQRCSTATFTKFAIEPIDKLKGIDVNSL